MVAVSELQDCSLQLPYTGIGIYVFVDDRISIFGQEYRPGLTVLPDISDEGESTFAVMQIFSSTRPMNVTKIG